MNMYNSVKCICVLYIWNVCLTCCSTKHCTVTYSEKVVTCDCSNMDFHTVPRHIPTNTTILDLSSNNIALLHNETFIQLAKLRTLIIHTSRLRHIDVNAFKGLANLQTLDLSANFLDVGSLPMCVFNSTPNLLNLQLSDNTFSEEYPDNSLSFLSSLQSLSINGIRNGRFGDGFKYLKKLKILHFKPCFITHLTNETFLVFDNLPIEDIAISCAIRKVEYGTLAPFKSLNVLKLSYNSLIRLSDLIPILIPLKDRNMSEIDLSYNYRARTGSDILTPEHFTILGQICVKSLILAKNQISVIRSGSISSIKYKNCLEHLDLSRNNIYGDTGSALELFQLTGLKTIDASQQDLLSPWNVGSLSRNISPKTSKFLMFPDNNVSEVFKRGSTIYTFPLPPNLEEIFAERIVIKALHLANVNVTHGRKLRVLDLNWTPFKSCTGRLRGIDHLEILKVSGFNCSLIDLSVFQSFKKLKVLESRSANLSRGLQEDKDGKILKGLIELQQIDFSANQFKYLNPLLFKSQYKSLLKLILSSNILTEINMKFSKFSKLNYIDLSDNRIRYLERGTTKELDVLNIKSMNKLELLLQGNIFECNCDSLHFIAWLHFTNVTLDNGGNYSCRYFDGSYKTTAFAFQNLHDIKTMCVSKVWLIFSVLLSVLLIIIIVASSIAYKYRITLQYWYLTIRRKYRHYSKLEGESKEYRYSAFVAYHNADYKWVCGPLSTFLEKEKEQSLCLHHRDFLAGNLIADNIVEAVSQSRKVILVISETFLESSWCEFELDMARMQMFQESRNMLIVILVQNIPAQSMPKSLLRIWNKVTCLEAYDSDILIENDNFEHIFWNRLYEAVLL
ncbi:toll-like receptor 7 [Mytilus galloprovincialis]|uniref:Toll-like receptor 7 n=2 Tax=Mytilus galloprovincialis TaxID=29158 RepID=A0A8B6EW33_MYTGA|nr:toll-like receptor 7 [Mytilus galloprovincialis]